MNVNNQTDNDCIEVRPAGVIIDNVSIKKVGSLTFPNSLDATSLFPPVAQATVVEVNNEKVMQISIVVFVDKNSNVNPNNGDLSVIQYFSYNKQKTPFANFYVCYDVKPEPGTEFEIFQLNFTADSSKAGYTPNPKSKDLPIPSIFNLKEIVSFLWDEDPVGSRGTVTTVKFP